MVRACRPMGRKRDGEGRREGERESGEERSLEDEELGREEEIYSFMPYCKIKYGVKSLGKINIYVDDTAFLSNCKSRAERAERSSDKR